MELQINLNGIDIIRLNNVIQFNVFTNVTTILHKVDENDKGVSAVEWANSNPGVVSVIQEGEYLNLKIRTNLIAATDSLFITSSAKKR